MILSLFAWVFVVAVCFIYPIYNSYKAIKYENIEEQKSWLEYWIIFSCFYITESLLDILLSWFPFYFILKYLFLLCLVYPSSGLASFLFATFILPFFNAREEKIDDNIKKMFDDVSAEIMKIGRIFLFHFKAFALHYLEQNKYNIMKFFLSRYTGRSTKFKNITTFNIAVKSPQKDFKSMKMKRIKETASKRNYEDDDDNENTVFNDLVNELSIPSRRSLKIKQPEDISKPMNLRKINRNSIDRRK